MDQTSHLALPFILPGQAQKHVTHNEALRTLDAIVQLSVLDRDLADPPPVPDPGSRYLIAPGAGAAWEGQAGRIAVWDEGSWSFLLPRAGWLAWIADEHQLLAFDGLEWTKAGGEINPTPLVGVNATADETNRLALKSPASLFDHAGTDHRLKINKAGAAQTATLLFQSGYSGRAELGLAGDDQFRIKTSADGSAWQEALSADPATGALTFPAGQRHGPSGKPMRNLILTPGGDGQVSIYRNDRTRAQSPRTAIVQSIGGDVITLSSASADLFFHAFMAGVSMVRVWNQSKSPEQAAWIKAVPDWGTGRTQLQVHAGASIASWSAGDVVRLGDPFPSVVPTRSFALDISPMMGSVLGAVFRASGIFLKTSIAGIGARASISFSASALGGSFIGVNSLSDGATGNAMVLCACTELSPVSNSNLLLVREDDAGAGVLGITIGSAIAMLA